MPVRATGKFCQQIQTATIADRDLRMALDLQERQELLLTLNRERFADCAPTTVYATLLDEGRYFRFPDPCA